MILIAGLGYIGETLADHLQQSGENIAGLRKTPESAATLAPSKAYPVRACDIGKNEEVHRLAAALEDVTTVVHCASSGRGGEDSYRNVYLEGARNLLENFPAARLLFTSSTSVYAQDDGSTVTEKSDTTPDRETGRILVEAERLILSRGGTVARLSGIYGPGRSIYLKRILTGEAVIEGDGARFLNQAHRTDIVSAISLLLSLPEASGQIYNVTDNQSLTQRECYEFLAAHFDRPPPPAASADLARKRGLTHKRVSNSKLRALGWTPAYPSFKDAVLGDPDLVDSIKAAL